ncbi:MAG: hypothetical protein RIQ84_1243 [Pseudomonadota bacterium]
MNLLRRKIFFSALFSGVYPVLAFAEKNFALVNYSPKTNAGRPWRVAYLETRPFVNYAATLANLAIRLGHLGWIENIQGIPFEKGQVDSRVIWNWLSHRNGQYLQFLRDGFYSFENLNPDEINAATESIVSRLSTQKDVDLIVVMGTESAQKISTDRHSIPMISMSTSNAMQSGIVKKAEYSGREHIWAHMDPFRYERQIDIFYDIFKFKKLGIVFDDDQAGRSFSAYEDIIKVAKKRNFSVIVENVMQPKKYGANKDKFIDDLKLGYTKLSSRVDAVYHGLFIGSDPKKLHIPLSPLIQKKIPVFAQQVDDVSAGALMSLARADFSGVADFGAKAMIRVIKGEKAGEIPQIYENSPNIVINLGVAKQIGYKPSFELLLGADEVIHEIK